MTCYIQIGLLDENGVEFIRDGKLLRMDGCVLTREQVEAFLSLFLNYYHESSPDACQALCAKILATRRDDRPAKIEWHSNDVLQRRHDVS